ncbi:MAG: DUF1640 domain-containing protein [Magnetococcales bacterium]|nr:DUF1640 domain-containing protein [Magnetococcales bacterium]
MSGSLVFDTHSFVKKLVSTGFTEEQAETQVRLLTEVLEGQRFIMADLAKVDARVLELKRDIEWIRRDMKEIDSKIEATKAELQRDIEVVKTELKRDIKELDSKIEATKAELKRDIKELDSKIEATKAELKRDIKELDSKIEATKAELKRDIEVVKTELKRDIEVVKAELKRDIKEVDARIELTRLELRKDIETAKVETIKWVVATGIIILGGIATINRYFPPSFPPFNTQAVQEMRLPVPLPGSPAVSLPR